MRGTVHCDTRARWDEALASGVRIIEEDGVWTFLDHDLVSKAANDPETFSSAVSRFLQVPNGLDGAEHARYRALVDTYMTPALVAGLEPACRRIAHDVVRDLDTTEEAIEVIGDLGAPFAARAAIGWLGWNQTSESELLTWMDAHQAASCARDSQSFANVANDFDAIVRRELDARSGQAASFDVTSKLMRDESSGALLTTEQIVSVLRNWTAGDLVTIAACIGVIVHGLATDARLQKRMRVLTTDLDDASLRELDLVIDELLRIDDPFLSNRRVTTRDIVIDGHDIPAQSRINLAWTAANRDPVKFANPDAVCLHNNAATNLVYGTGPHVCPGRALSTMQLRSITVELLSATDRIYIAQSYPASRSSGGVGGWDKLFIELSTKQPE